MGITTRAGATLAATALTGLLGTACEPLPNSIGLTLDRAAWVTGLPAPGGGGQEFVLTGTVSCSRGGEPIDLFPTVRQNDVDHHLSVRNIPCTGSDPQPWRVSWTTTGSTEVPAITVGDAYVRLYGGTNPSEQIDEDFVYVERYVNVRSK